jgi:hypothetical protein
MPANLPPQYFDKEKELKNAKTPQEKMAILEDLLAIVPKHKGTEKLQALLKTKLAKLRDQSQKKPSVARHANLYQIEKAGAGQLVLVGGPNSGKSSLVKVLTNASPEIGDYPFTTHSPSPAMMPYENIQIQLIDLPPITPDFMEFWQAELIKGADGILVVLDVSAPCPRKPRFGQRHYRSRAPIDCPIHTGEGKPVGAQKTGFPASRHHSRLQQEPWQKGGERRTLHLQERKLPHGYGPSCS